MTTVECPREQDVVDALVSSRWPDRCDADLRRHAERCRVCADLVEIVNPLRDDMDTAWRQARIPSSAVMWWRAQMRARQEAAVQAARPVTIAYGVGAVAAAAIAIALLVAMAPWLQARLAGVDDGVVGAVWSGSGEGSFVARSWLVTMVLLAGIGLVLTPVAAYLALSDD